MVDLELFHDQTPLKNTSDLMEEATRRRYPNLVVASLVGPEKEKTDGQVTSSVLLDETYGNYLLFQNQASGQFHQFYGVEERGERREERGNREIGGGTRKNVWGGVVGDGGG